MSARETITHEIRLAVREEIAPLHAEITELRATIAELKPTIPAARPPRRRGYLSGPEADRLCVWLEQHREDWSWLPYDGTIRGWLNGRSRPSRRLVAQLWTSPRDAAAPGLDRPEPELLELLEGDDGADDQEHEPDESGRSEEGTS